MSSDPSKTQEATAVVEKGPAQEEKNKSNNMTLQVASNDGPPPLPPPPVEKVPKRTQPKVMVPLVPLVEGLRCKQPVTELQAWVALALTLDGRDKITKVCQYIARFMAWFLSGTGQGKRFAALKVSLTNSRKAFRLGRSIIEFHRLRSMGLYPTLVWHLHQSLGQYNDNDENVPEPRVLLRKASSNIGWGPATLVEVAQQHSRRFYRSMSSLALTRMYRPLASRLVSFASSVPDTAPPSQTTPLVVVVGTALKLLGLWGFWTGDNFSFLTMSGLFDNYQLPLSDRVTARQRLAARASRFANRSYFMGSVAGLAASLRAYYDGYRKMMGIKRDIEQADGDEEELRATKAFDAAKTKQFSLAMALLKSCCDVLVFSNNPGVNVWVKSRGRPMHEGFHCLCGLLSASTVLYNNFPNAIKNK